MAFSAEEEKFFQWAKAALPRWFFALDRAYDDLGAFVKVFDAARQVIVAYFKQAYLADAEGGTPDWLVPHASDRGTSRQSGESDAVLIARLRKADNGSIPELLAAVNAMIAAAGVAGSCGLVELRRDRAFLRTDTPSGRKDAFLSRGYRATVPYPGGTGADAGKLRYPHAFVVILPYGSSAALATAVAEFLRQRKASGFRASVERRLNP